MTTLDLPLEINLKAVHLTDEQFYQLCIHNPEMAIEQNAQGVLIVMPPVGGESGNQEMELGTDLALWNRQTKLGVVFSSSTVFQLPIGSKRSPDAAWVEQSRWEALTPDQRRKFPPIAPDFVMEVRSSTDSLELLQAKMHEYMVSGVRLGWLFDPKGQRVEVYRPGQAAAVRRLPTQLSGESVLPGFILNVSSFA
ncbi:Uma2 family endonuclease [Nodosilinea sp. LEGE 06152]|uniref:Uma2 family endonuclease n=1 Tax=Nodosilinea sp. LEGE 06152 TaxID=2777966 RepID=UPI0018806090|nr:Uma2 family endonuclease [Nodosilinea sp. LEGE 06152]MBE9155407.1 Uma2 family endonuclease [Nodosilinea sp. LEGE 06152]